ncbi:hypothetical protein Pint_10030 [Pistacia integerrima]|uniref:Uncharacterized protein n=1 Tax=Pistacia integerrima TaxID=434235 RepID=A0ACC0XIS0_9ROSI|nr:hypothetical protein Pint_10030 [Pistacia integerrima]
MAKATFSLAFLPLLVMFLFFNSGIQKQANAADAVKTWCVAKPSANETQLGSNLEFACSQMKEGCKEIEFNGPCYMPNTTISRASYAMNLYYALSGRNPWNCDFSGTGLVTTTDPGYGPCVYA